MTRSIRLFVIDDHPLILEGVRASLLPRDRIEVVGDASNGKEALLKLQKITADVILLDVLMPGLNGMEITRILRRRFADAKILIFTGYHNPEYRAQLNRCGADALLLKGCSPAGLISAIKSVHRGRSPSQVSDKQPEATAQLETAELTGSAPVSELSEREVKTLAMIAEGCTNKEIGYRLEISVRTVEKHRETLMDKLNLHSIAELTKYALVRGLASY